MRRRVKALLGWSVRPVVSATRTDRLTDGRTDENFIDFRLLPASRPPSPLLHLYASLALLGGGGGRARGLAAVASFR